MSDLLMRELVNEFTKQNISMPDDARERIILTDPSESVSSLEEKQPSQIQNGKNETVEQTKTLVLQNSNPHHNLSFTGAPTRRPPAPTRRPLAQNTLWSRNSLDV